MAAHIKTASPRRPRYDGTLTAHERASSNNRFCACAHCADIIDGNAAAFSVQQLQVTKAGAERPAATPVAKVPAPETFQPPLSSLPLSIQPFCLAEADRYEAMDNRLESRSPGQETILFIRENPHDPPCRKDLR